MQVALKKISGVRARTSAGARMARAGMGMYPGDECYDPTRSSWLPYWLDTWTESLCKYGNDSAEKDIKVAQAAAAEVIKQDQIDAAGGDESVVDTSKSDAETVRLAIARDAAAASRPKTCTGFNTYNTTSKVCEFDPSRPSFLFLVGGIAVAIVTVVVLKK
jgi:hypothetical protein